ncbi:dockerin type I domain-containing protein [Candidatus Poribacteria bacterium]
MVEFRKTGRITVIMAAITIMLWAVDTGFPVDFSGLVEGVNQIWSPGTPGPLYALNDTPVTIVSGDEDTSSPSAFVMAAKYGNGQVVAIGHGGPFEEHGIDRFDNMRFGLNIVTWLDKLERKKMLIDTGHGEWAGGANIPTLIAELEANGYQVVQNSSMFTESLLSDCGVLYINTIWSGSVTPEEVEAIRNFVDSGGGLFILGLGWSWEPYHPGSTLDDYPMNQIAAPYGIRWMRGDIGDPTNNHEGSPIFHTFYPDTRTSTVYEAFAYIKSVTDSHTSDLPQALQADGGLRKEYTNVIQVIAVPTNEFEPDHPQRTEVYNLLKELISDFPQYYSKPVTFDKDTENVMAWTRERVCRIFIDATPMTPSVSAEIASTVQLWGRYLDIWSDFGIYLLDNSSLDQQQLDFIYSYLNLIPPGLHNLRAISVRDFLGSNIADISLSGSDGGVNIFGVAIGGYSENSFPSDSEPGVVDGFSIVVAHEVNHVVDAYTFGSNAEMLERKQTLIEQAAPSDIIFKDHSMGLGVDWDSTKSNFQLLGYWNGQQSSWDSAWNDYWNSGPGYDANANWLKNNLRLMCEAPQEAFATLANQYFTNSETMLNLALDRFGNGRKICINQFLFFADVYSVGGERTFFYIIDTEGNIQREDIFLSRDINGQISSLLTDSGKYRFALDGNANVLSYSYVVPASAEERPYDLNQDGIVDTSDLIIVAQQLGESVTTPTEPNPDVNGDGTVDILDIVLVANHFGEVHSPAAPSKNIWKVDREHLPLLTKIYNIMAENPNSGPDFLAAKSLLHRLISDTRISKTEVFQNYPNPFNPDTWVPYQLREDSDVIIKIYTSAGQLVRTLDLGHKSAGVYISKEKAAYWDGRNEGGEKTVSGVYFYNIQAGDFTATKKMTIVE